MKGAFYRVRNWEKFQHYKNRNPPWIKLHTELLDNYQFSCLQDASKLLAICFLLLAARSDNKIPGDLDWIKRRCNLKSTPDIKPLLDSGFIEEIQTLPDAEQDASTTLADCKQLASPRALARGEAEERRDRGASAPDPVGLNPEAWRVWQEYRKLKPASIPFAKRRLAKFGADQLAVVEQSIAGEWRGLFELKHIPAKQRGGDNGLPFAN